MSDQSEFGIVLANAPRLQRAFGRKLAALIVLISLFLARRPSARRGVLAALIFVAALILRLVQVMSGIP